MSHLGRVDTEMGASFVEMPAYMPTVGVLKNTDQIQDDVDSEFD